MSASQRTAKECSSRPPRLQPSPSLPNLRMRNMSLQPHLSRPQQNSHKPPSQLLAPSPAALSSKVSYKEEEPHPPNRSRNPSKNQHYLTPPLTPASSLKSDSTDPDSTDLNTPNDEVALPASHDITSGDNHLSRFLIIGNVPNDLSEDIIGPYFHALASSTNDLASSARSGSVVAQSDSTTDKVIQTIYYRFQESRAIVLAFYDSRDADRVRRLIGAKSSQPQYDLVGKGKQTISYDRQLGGPWEEALTCLFVVPDHFLKLLGQPATAVMTCTEGAFCISVDGMLAGRDHDRFGWSRIRSFVPVKLKSVLVKYGELKSFRLLEEDEDNCSQVCLSYYADELCGMSLHALCQSPLF
ncbi:hypothetical protein HYDPIDRAFT_107419 [Hydnomerulius pinastri MD-312]|nr:hypothetical protein HYDPIDRAFT_107419 [Hydnomerulius pinastri MD-312]